MSSTGDAAEAFAKVTSQIKSDMAAMEKSAKAIEQHLGIDGQIAGGRKQPGVPRHSAQQVCPRIMDLAADPAIVAFLGGGGPRAE